MKQTRLQQMQIKIEEGYGKEIADEIGLEFERLCQSQSDILPSFSSHAYKNIFPVVATYRTLLKFGYSSDLAESISSQTFLQLMEVPKKKLQNMMRVPGLYRCMPWLWKKLVPKMFGKDAGFDFRFYPTKNDQVKFDMVKCPYYEMCKLLDCENLAWIFCKTDDICYGNMHFKLKWLRTQTIANGDSVCDFHLKIDKK